MVEENIKEKYQEPIKNTARNRLLERAIRDLTANRNSSYILRSTEVEETYSWAFDRLLEYKIIDDSSDIKKKFDCNFQNWLKTHREMNEKKNAESLKVLFLCGPKPSNDLEIFLKNGILIQNVWAVESNRDNYDEALKDLRSQGMPLKIHKGDLAQFLRTNNNNFDIIYLDACGPLCGGKPNTLNPILEIFAYERLAPLSALITNFSEIKDKSNYYSGIIASYFMGRYDDYPPCVQNEIDPHYQQYDGEDLKRIIKSKLQLFYSDFITRLLTDFGRYIIPNCRALSNTTLFDNLLRDKNAAKDIIETVYRTTIPNPENSEKIDEYWLIDNLKDWELSPTGYPLLTFLRNQPQLSNSGSLTDKIKNISINGKKIRELLPLASVLDKIIEGHWKIATKKLLIAVYIWFDREGGYFCDVPMPNLAINSHLGAYGHPYHLNTRKMDRISYKAKSTRMYADYLLLDKCDEFYNWYPMVDQAIEFFKHIENQILARAMIDRMGRYDWYSSSHPFRGSALISFYDIDIAEHYEICERDYI